MLIISSAVHLPDHGIKLNAIRAQGTGGQSVNKISSAVYLHFGIQASSLPPFYEERLLAPNNQRISGDGVVVVEAQQYWIQEQNREDALERLTKLIRSVAKVQRARCPTRPTHGSQKRRLDGKTKRGAVKAERGKVGF